MAKKLRKLQVSSVDLCKRGANQEAHIALAKSAEGGEEEMVEQIGKSIAYAYGVEMTDGMIKQLDAINKAMVESEATIKADNSLDRAEKGEMLKKSRGEYRKALIALMKANGEQVDEEDEDKDEDDEQGDGEVVVEESDDEDEEDDVPPVKVKASKGGKGVKKGMGTAVLKTGVAILETEMHPEVKKALGEVANMRKELEMGKMREVAKKYEVIGKSVDDLAPKLYELKKSGDTNFNEYIALLDQMVECTEKSGIFKEIGSNRSGGVSNDLNQTVAEIQKAMPELSRAEAIVRAYETNPALSEY